MNALRLLTTMIMSAGFGFFGISKIAKSAIVTENPGWSRLAEGEWATIGALEVTAVVALLLALHPRLRSLGVAAAAGLATLTACAVVYHVVNGDPAGDIAPAVIQGLVATTYVALGTRQLRSVTAVSSTGLAVA